MKTTALMLLLTLVFALPAAAQVRVAPKDDGPVLRIFAVGDLLTDDRTTEQLAELIRANITEGIEHVQAAKKGSLVVKGTVDAQNEVEEFLTDLRRSRTPMVMISAKFIEVPGPEFLRDVGIEARGVAFLDDVETQLLLRAVEKSAGASLIQSPGLTCYDRQEATISVGTEVSYIKDFDVEVLEDGSQIADPVIAKLFEGLLMKVQPVLSVDRKFVTLALDVAVSDVADPISTLDLPMKGGVTVEIQQPQLRETRLKTSVTLASGGRALLNVGRVPGRTKELLVILTAHELMLSDVMERKPK